MDDNVPVFYFDSSDPAMFAAAERARDTFKYFWRELSWERRRIIPGLDLACVKLAFAELSPSSSKPEVEYMWVDDVDFDGVVITGTLLNSPNTIRSVSRGDHITAPLLRVADWMFAVSRKVYGAFTVNLMRSRMSRSERQDHDKAWGLDFGDPSQVSVVHVQRRKETTSGLLDRFRRSASGVEDLEAAALLDHPMSLNMEQSLRQSLSNRPEIVTDRDDRGWTFLHREALAGNRNIVKALLEFGADRHAKTPQGQSPLDLAKVLRWDATIGVLSDKT